MVSDPVGTVGSLSRCGALGGLLAVLMLFIQLVRIGYAVGGRYLALWCPHAGARRQVTAREATEEDSAV